MLLLWSETCLSRVSKGAGEWEMLGNAENKENWALKSSVALRESAKINWGFGCRYRKCIYRKAEK